MGRALFSEGVLQIVINLTLPDISLEWQIRSSLSVSRLVRLTVAILLVFFRTWVEHAQEGLAVRLDNEVHVHVAHTC